MLVYLIKQKNTDLYKIGITKNANKRKLQIQTGSPQKIEILYLYESEMASKIERFFHKKYFHTKFDETFDKIEGEWFKLNPKEVLSFNDDCQKIEDGFKLLKELDNPFV